MFSPFTGWWEAWKKPGILKLKNLEFKKKSLKKPGKNLEFHS
jgi:hypothetical protein